MRKINVLMFYYFEGWAWRNKIRQIEKNISGDFNIEVLKVGTPFEHEAFDFVLTFTPFIDHIQYVPSYKIIAGCSHPVYLEELKSLLEEKRCIGGFVNSLEMFREISERENVFCCQNGVDTHLFCPHPPPKRAGQLTACWVGNSRHVGNKGLDLIKKACKKTGIPLKYLDRQPGKQEDLLLSPEKVRDNIYYKSSVYICASQSDATPNPALEALSCGLPVISTPVGNMPEIIRDGYNGFLVERSVDSIAAAIEKLKKTDPDRLSRNARESIENGWTWKQQVKKYETMFLNLLEKQHRLLKSGAAGERDNNMEGLLQLARSYYDHNNYNGARRKFSRLLEIGELTDRIRSLAYYYLGNILESEKNPRWKAYLEKSNDLLIPAENKSAAELYRIASVFKRLGQFDKSGIWFQRVLEKSDKKDIVSGVFFHLGEMQFTLNREKSRYYFDKCLQMNPGHRLARQYQGQLTADIQ